MKKNSCNIDQLQLLLAKGVAFLPLLDQEFDKQLYELELKEKICLLPSTTLKLYNIKLRRHA